MSGRLENLDALRALAAIAVMIQHLLGHVWRTMPIERVVWIKALSLDYFDLGRFGVVLFFLTSGYVIPLSFRGPTPMKKFFISRLFRLYPAFWLSVLLNTILMNISGVSVTSFRLLANLTMIYPIFHQSAISGIYWTLIVEIIFYSVAYSLFFFRVLEWPLMIMTLAVIAVCSAVIPISAKLAVAVSLPTTFLGYHLSFLFFGSLIRQSLAQIPYARTMALVLGMVIAVTMPLVSGLFTGEFGNPTNYSLARPVGAMLSVTAAIFVFLLFWRECFRHQTNIALDLGAWSYSIYLFHEPVATIMTWFIEPSNFGRSAVFVISVCIITIVLSSLVYTYIEKPCIQAGQRLVKGDPSKAATNATS